MPSPRRHLKSARPQGHSPRQHGHLLIGHDMGHLLDGPGWGHLAELPDDELRLAVEDMCECWSQSAHLVTAEYVGLHHEGPAWFEDYHWCPQKLIDEVLANPNRAWYLRLAHKSPALPALEEIE